MLKTKFKGPLKLNNKGFGHIELAFGLLIVAVIAFAGDRVLSASHAASINTLTAPQAEHVSDAKSDLPPNVQIGDKTESHLIDGVTGYCNYGACFYYNEFNIDSINAAGASVSITQAAPKLGANDLHSLAELRVESSDDQQAVEIGWTVAIGTNEGTLPRLFVYHWVNGEQTCYNGCGFVQTSSKYIAGQNVKVGATGTYSIKFSGSRWLLVYNGVTIGYMPESIWGGDFTNAGAVAIYGEVASTSSTTPESQMGDGRLGTNPKATAYSNFKLIGNTGKPSYYFGSLNSPIYSYGLIKGNGDFSFGGPGYPPGTVLPQPPTITLDPATISSMTATIDGSVTPASGTTITSLSWNWGDGTSTTDASLPGSHTYSAPGTYVATLTAVGSNGLSANLSDYVTIP